MRELAIRHVSVDEAGRLSVTPDLDPQHDFFFIYRAAMEVAWSPSTRSLVSPPVKPGGWAHGDWFGQIVKAVADEYRTKLVLRGGTTWAVPDGVRMEIERAGSAFG